MGRRENRAVASACVDGDADERSTEGAAPHVDLCIPVCNGAHRIDQLLRRVSEFRYSGTVRVICVANGCTDDTAARARTHEAAFVRRGWALLVVEREAMGKPAAIRGAEALADGGLFGLLDVNVVPSTDALERIVARIVEEELSLVSGQLRYVEGGSWVTRRFARAYARSPYARSTDVKGNFMVVAAHHRDVIRQMPDIGADDRYLLLSSPRSKRATSAGAEVEYHFPASPMALVRQQIRWRRNNRFVNKAVSSAHEPAHESNRWPYFDPVPDPTSIVVYFGITVLAEVVARVRLRDTYAWSR